MIFILTTCKNTTEAKRIATMLLRSRLVACTKWWPIQSSYWWKGRLIQSRETTLLCEAPKKHFTKIERLIRRVHSYENPCIVSVDIQHGSKLYFRWLRETI
ncbi:divalent-cation tolerance protein CutA [Candidatus Uhrbacteria bacterium]|nr:divalent-cation tolerance protein CutA [Candidatus Uhrbacteria bacterium]